MRPYFVNTGGILFFVLVLGVGILVGVSAMRTRRGGTSASLLLRASPLRATSETILLAAGLVVASFALTLPAMRRDEVTFPIDPTLVLLAGPICALWCALRLRIPGGPRWRWMIGESVIGAVLALAPFAIVV